MTTTLGRIYRECPAARDEQLAEAQLCLFVDINGQTYSITPIQLIKMLELAYEEYAEKLNTEKP